MTMTKKYVYAFGDGKAEGDKSMKFILGGKGANLAEMSSIGLPVPAGFTISTEVCKYYNEMSDDRSQIADKKEKYPKELEGQVDENIKKLEENPEAGKPLRNKLKGYRCLRVKSFRIIYRFSDDKIIIITFQWKSLHLVILKITIITIRI